MGRSSWRLRTMRPLSNYRRRIEGQMHALSKTRMLRKQGEHWVIRALARRTFADIQGGFRGETNQVASAVVLLCGLTT